MRVAVPGVLLAVIGWSHAARAHLGVGEGFVLPTGEGALGVLTATSVLFVALAGAGYVARKASTGRRPGPDWVLAIAGIAWVTLGHLRPDAWVFTPAWRGLAIVLVLGTIAGAWWVAWPSLRVARGLLPGRRAASVAGLSTGLAFLLLFAFGTHLVLDPDAHEAAAAGAEGFMRAYETFGPLAVWPDLEWWWPGVGLGGHVTPASAVLALTLAAFFGVSVALLVAARIPRGAAPLAGSGAASLAVNLCACCTPALYPLLVALLGSAAAPLVYAMSDPDQALYDVAQVANVWLLTAAVVQGATRVAATCAFRASRPVP